MPIFYTPPKEFFVSILELTGGLLTSTSAWLSYYLPKFGLVFLPEISWTQGSVRFPLHSFPDAPEGWCREGEIWLIMENGNQVTKFSIQWSPPWCWLLQKRGWSNSESSFPLFLHVLLCCPSCAVYRWAFGWIQSMYKLLWHRLSYPKECHCFCLSGKLDTW